MSELLDSLNALLNAASLTLLGRVVILLARIEALQHKTTGRE